MDTQHVLNPWNAQHLHAKELDFPPPDQHSIEQGQDREGSHLDDFYRFTTQDYAEDLNRLHSRRQAHMRSWSCEETIAASDIGDNDSDSEERKRPITPMTCQTPEQRGHDDLTSTEQTHEEDNDRSDLTASSATLVETSVVGRSLTDSGIGMEGEGDVLEHLVQKLQSEVADTRSIVFDLESRLNAAEHSNKHIVEELKTLLADAEGTLVGSDDSDSGDSFAVSSKHGGEEDSNVVYNRICNALQTLITEAQSALVRKTSLTPPLLDSPLPPLHRRLRLRGRRPDVSVPGTALFLDEADTHQPESFNPSSCRTSRRSSWAPSRSERSLRPPTIITQLSPSPLPSPRISGHHTNLRSFSRMIWKEKQQEQYERYRRSCDMISYELQTMLDDSLIDSDIGEAAEELLLTPPVVKPAALFGTWSLDRAGLSLKRFSGDNRKPVTATPSISKAERVQRKYQAQVLGSQVRAARRRREELELSTVMERESRRNRSVESNRHFKSQGVGPSPSQNILIQLYRLWKHSWLRTRIMHVLTGSLEMMLIVWVVYKLSEISLGWMGVRLLTNNMNNGPQEWLAYIYGYRNSAGASAAKELYKKIRQEGLAQRTRRILRERESEALMVDYIKSETAPGMPTRHFSSAGMVWRPAGNALAHIVSGVVLAYLSDRARNLSRKL